MLIPLEGDRLLFTRRLVALVRRDGRTDIVVRDGPVEATGLTPKTLRERQRRLWSRGRTEAMNLLQGGQER